MNEQMNQSLTSMTRILCRRIGPWQVLLVALFILLGNTAYAQVAPLPFSPPQFLDNNGHPLAGGRLFSYQAGTSTNLATFCDALGTVTNANPIILNAGGRPGGGSPNNCGVFLGSNAYKFVLQDSLGRIIWSVDNISASNLGLLASNNVWTGTNTFNNSVTLNGTTLFNVGFSSSGPNNMSGGGSLAGTWSGTPTFSGMLNFAGGFTTTTGSFSGQITSLVGTGTAPFVISSSTNVPNLNASFLLDCTWAVPCAIGATTPNSGVFTTLQANTSLTVNSLADGCASIASHVLTTGTCAATQIQSVTRKQLATNVSLPNSSVTTVDTQVINMPTTGCPCRVMISYSYWVVAVGGSAPYTVDFYVTDGTNVYAPSENGSGNSNVLSGNSASDVAGPYANSDSVTFTINADSLANGGGGTQVREFGANAGTIRSYTTFTVIPSKT